MRHRRRRSFARALSVLLLSLTFCGGSAVNTFANTHPAPPSDDDHDYEETARVARVSLLRGDVSLRRAGSQKWERAALNLPLVEGDRLATGSDARLEIQIDARNFIRLGEYATIDIITLREEGVALSVAEGTATLRLARFESGREYFEIDAPGSTIAAEKRGVYRLDVAQSSDVRVTVRDGGRARIYSESSGFTLRDGRTAFLRNDAADAGDWDLSAANSFDTWDAWVDERERHLAVLLRHDNRDRYYDRHVWGAEELDAYGDWVQTNDYGYVWRPHVTVINNYHNWTPYRYGRWTWCPPYGWTWVGDEPWGWAPYHYGRWVYANNSWCWAPRGYHNYRRSWWRPALVAFVYLPNSYGEHVAWYPLGYHQSDPHARYYRAQPGRLTPLRRDEIANLQRVNPIYQRAVNALPARDFGRGNAVRGQPATAELARRAVNAEPVRGRLPIRPIDSEGTNGRSSGDAVVAPGRERRGAAGLTIVRPDSSGAPARTLSARPTGAATRRPGVALDETLRRERIYNNREARPASPPRLAIGVDGAAVTNPGDERIDRGGGRSTGVVARPSRPAAGRVPEAGADDERRVEPSDRIARPVRPPRPADADESARPREPSRIERPERRERRPPAPIRDDGNDSSDTPSSDERRARPLPPEREERPADPPREERPTRPEVRDEERPAPEVNRPAPPREERRPDAPRERPEPRYERPEPRYERPEPRHEQPAPPPPREERPAAPPQREERPAPPPPAPERRPDPPARESQPARPSRKMGRDEPKD